MGNHEPVSYTHLDVYKRQAKDFIDFILSEEGQAVVEENGYVSEGNTGAFEGTKPEGKIRVGGSSSVTRCV